MAQMNQEFLTVAGLVDIATLGWTSWKAIETVYEGEQQKEPIREIIDKIENNIDFLKRSEEKLLSCFKGLSGNGPPANENELQQVFARFYAESGLNKFSGEGVRKIIQGYQNYQNEDFNNQQQLLSIIINEAINRAIQEIQNGKLFQWGQDPTLDNEILEKAEKIFHSLLQKALSKISLQSRGSQGIVTVTVKTDFLKVENGKVGFDFSEITPAIKKRLKELLDVLNYDAKNKIKKERTYNKKRYDVLFSDDYNNQKYGAWVKDTTLDDVLYLQNFNVSNNTNNTVIDIAIELGRYWGEQTEGLSGSKMRTKTREKQKEVISNRLIKQLLNYLNLPEDIKPGAEKIIRKMVKSSNYEMFYIGGNEKDITGLLGEISTYIAIYHLLNDKYQNRIITWVAQQHSVSGRQLSIDLVLYGIAGIQVKNTSLEWTEINKNGYLVTFEDTSPERIFQKLNIPYMARENLAKILISDDFNIGYVYKGQEYHRRPSGKLHPSITSTWDYRQVEKEIKKLAQEIDLYLKLFTPQFLYMANNDDLRHQLATLNQHVESLTNEQHGNLMYIVATVPFLASNRLEIIKKELENFYNHVSDPSISTSFKMGIERSLDKKPAGDIVSFLNSNRGNRNKIKETKIKYKSSFAF